MPARPDFQTDYEDPVDRLYRPRVPREKVVKPVKRPNPAATAANAMGMVSLVPCVGLLFAPVAIMFGVVGLSNAADQAVGGKEKAKTGLWFGLVGVVINYLVPLALYIWALSMR